MAEPPTERTLVIVAGDDLIQERVRSHIDAEIKRRGGHLAHLSSNDFAKSAFNFLLTGIVGLLLTRCYQSRDDNARRAAEARAAQRGLQMTAVDSVGAVMNRTYYGFTRLYDGIRTSAYNKWPKDTVDARRSRMRALRDDYYGREMVMKARLCAVFGDRVYTRFAAVDSALRQASSNLSAYSGDLGRESTAWSSLEEYRVRTQSLLTEMVSAASDTSSLTRAQCASVSGPHRETPDDGPRS